MYGYGTILTMAKDIENMTEKEFEQFIGILKQKRILKKIKRYL